ncbi:DNA primase [Neolewinella antarctica]|uniref:DNA primase n=1 Tax=Neolewinella antarctica TaxID=442734 RepID=A0ABX0X827_9BACT|nr:DNA primase [Neolewinella antarctica]NJC25139.1 DNA primase [Neolewinella antarctica]
MIKEESVREVIDMARVEDIVGDYVNLRRRGNNMTGLCPFHNEKTPSFNVNPARNIYKCFGCGEGGDPVKFLMTLEQLSFPDAIRKIAARYNFKLEEVAVSEEVREERREKESLLLVNDFARQFYEDQLYNTDEGKSVGLSYFKKRGFRKDVMERFGLGYAPMKRDALFKAATAAGYKAEQLDQLGLIRNKRDFFFDRVMFTIHNLQGKPIAFAGRILKKDVKAPKYVNSPETEVYHKSDVLYGIFQARQSIRKLDNVYVVEGYTDVISLHQNGITNVVATSGTSLTPGQARLVKRQTENVTLLYDGDKAGIKAALRGVDVLLIEGLNVRVVILPDGEDPDSYLQKVGTTVFEKYLTETRRDFLFFKSDLLLEEAGDDVAARSAAIRSSIATLALVEDPLKRQGYVQQFSNKLGLEESLLINLVNTAVAERRASAKRDAEREERRRNRPDNRRDAPPFPGSLPTNSAPATAPPPPANSGEDAWAGMQEPGWAGGEDEQWGGMDDAQFPDDSVASPPRVGKPKDDALSDALKFAGHAYQEMDLARMLIKHGHKVYDEEAEQSVGAYLTANVQDLIEDFDHAPSKEVVLEVMREVQRSGKGQEPDYFKQSENPVIVDLAKVAGEREHYLSPKWGETFQVYLRQKDPDDNQRVYCDLFIRLFRMLKIERLCKKNADKIAVAAQKEDEKTLEVLFKMQGTLVGMRSELAAQLGAVVI